MTKQNNNKQTGAEKSVENNGNVEQQIPVNVLDTVTLETLIRDAITEHAESRTERYEVYYDRDKGKFKDKFLKVVRTYAKLAAVRRPNATIKIVDKYGEERLLNVQAYQAPDFLYELVNYSGRVYLTDEDRENENYITEAARKASDLDDEALAKEMMSPEDLLSFWRDYNSTTKHQVALKVLKKDAIPFSDLAGIMVKHEDAKSGYVFKLFKLSGDVSVTTCQARKVMFDALSMCGTETETLKVGQLVHRIATATSPADSTPESKEATQFVDSGK